jgi:hypothetical protein
MDGEEDGCAVAQHILVEFDILPEVSRWGEEEYERITARFTKRSYRR